MPDPQYPCTAWGNCGPSIGSSGYSDFDVPIDQQTPANNRPPPKPDDPFAAFEAWIKAHKTEAILGAGLFVILLTHK